MSISLNNRKSWADKEGVRTGAVGEYVDRIEICEANRATGFEFSRPGIETLRTIAQRSYRSKGVDAVLFGVPRGDRMGYAVYVQPGFLVDVGEDE